MDGKKIIYSAETPAQTKKLGFSLARAVLKGGVRGQALAIGLRGDLGAGKTNFVQGFARGLGIESVVGSPTFVIFKKYPLPDAGDFKTFYHVDCYRVAGGGDMAQLGIAGILRDPANIVAIEWPDIAKDALPQTGLSVDFEVTGKSARRITFDFSGL